MTLICSIIALEWAMDGNVVGAIIIFWAGGMIDAMIIDTLETLTAKGGSEK